MLRRSCRRRCFATEPGCTRPRPTSRGRPSSSPCSTGGRSRTFAVRSRCMDATALSSATATPSVVGPALDEHTIERDDSLRTRCAHAAMRSSATSTQRASPCPRAVMTAAPSRVRAPHATLSPQRSYGTGCILQTVSSSPSNSWQAGSNGSFWVMVVVNRAAEHWK